MAIARFIAMHKEIMYFLSKHEIRMDDFKYVDMYGDYESMNHLGLIEAVEKMIGLKIPIVDCCKCSTFWFTATFLVCEYSSIGIITIIAIAFLACISAVWLELAMGILDTLYNKCYERIWNTTTVTETDGDKGDTQTDHKDNSETALS